MSLKNLSVVNKIPKYFENKLKNKKISLIYKSFEKSNLPETQSLILDSSKAMNKLNWKPKLKIDEALSLTYDWFSRSLIDHDVKEFSTQQIMDYQKYG